MSLIAGIIVFAITSGSAAILNVQTLGHGAAPTGAADPAPLPYKGAGVIGGEGNYWNGVEADSFGHALTIRSPEKLIEADGKTATDVTLTFTGFASADYFPMSQGGSVSNDLLNSYLVGGPTASVRIEGLVPGASYHLFLFGSNSRGGGGGKFAVNGGAPQITQTGAGTQFSKGVDYVDFEGVKADQEGQLKVTLSAVDAAKFDASILNGFQLQGEFPPPGVGPRRASVANIKKVSDQRTRFITNPNVSFRYGGKKYAGLPDNWKKRSDSKKLDANRTQHTLTWTDPKTGLAIRVVGIEYRDYPAVEWIVYFKNTGSSNTPILKDIQALDVVFERGSEGEFILNGLKGDSTTPDSYEPYRLTLGPNAAKTFAPPSHSGKSTDGPDGWPYYNLRMPGGGALMAVGWPGQWTASFARDGTNGLRIKAGQQLTHLYLKPGEEIRTPLIVMLFWQDTDALSAHNLWRRWFMAHNIPHFDGQPQAPVASLQVTGAAQDTNLVKSYLEAGVKFDVCWRDAFNGGFTWYPSDTGEFKDKGNDIFGKFSWLNTGTWAIDTRVLPEQFKPFSKWIHKQGINFMLWFEPERVGGTNSWLATHHPEWLLGPTDATVGAILDEGNPQARDWLINHVDDLIKSQGLDWYREDMNGNGPVTAWRKHDTEDRQGITENFYVQGHLAFWDELKRRHPRLHLDSCASGGRRNDLETMRRAVPLARSDFVLPTAPSIIEGNQGHTYGLSFWLPWQGSQTWFTNSYACRSWYLPGFLMTRENDYLITQTEINPASAAFTKKTYAECAEIAPCMLGDYFPLTPYSREIDQWIAWQFNRPEQGRGVIQAFRRDKCTGQTLTVKLQGLAAKAMYTLKNFDTGTSTKTGAELMKEGITITVSEKPGAAIITYTKKGS